MASLSKDNCEYVHNDSDDNQQIEAHKVILAATSPFLEHNENNVKLEIEKYKAEINYLKKEIENKNKEMELKKNENMKEIFK